MVMTAITLNTCNAEINSIFLYIRHTLSCIPSGGNGFVWIYLHNFMRFSTVTDKAAL